LKNFVNAATKHKRNTKYQFWTHENHAIEFISYKFTMQKMAYMHLNPVKAGYVERADEWMHSSQRNYSDKPALIEIDKMDF